MVSAYLCALNNFILVTIHVEAIYLTHADTHTNFQIMNRSQARVMVYSNLLGKLILLQHFNTSVASWLFSIYCIPRIFHGINISRLSMEPRFSWWKFRG